MVVFPCASAQTVRTVALSGQAVPGALNGETFASFDSPLLNDAGHVALLARLAGGGVTSLNDRTLLTEQLDGLNVTAREGDSAYGAPEGFTWGDEFRFKWNDDSVVAFHTRIRQPGVTNVGNVGIWTGGSEPLNLVARYGGQISGATAGATFSSINSAISLNNSGEVAFVGFYKTAPNGASKSAVWLGDEANARFILQGTSNDPFYSVVVNDVGQTLVRSSRIFDGRFFVDGFVTEHDGVASTLVKSGDLAPGTSGRFSNFALFPEMNSAGESAFLALLQSPQTNIYGIWAHRDGALQLVVRQGDAASGVPGATFQISTSNDPVINDQGQVAIWSYLSDNSRGIWIDSGNGLVRIVSSGLQAPGMAEGVKFTQIGSPALNNLGQVVFHSATTTNYPGGLWATDVTGQLTSVVQVGAVMEVAPNDLRTVKEIALGPANDNRTAQRYAINDRGQIAFAASFTDGTSGVFVSDAVAPTPGDYNRDGLVDADDLLVWQTSVGIAGANLPADGDWDGDVDGSDFLVWQRRAVVAAPTLAAVETLPEPATPMLTIIAFADLTFGRRRHSHR